MAHPFSESQRNRRHFSVQMWEPEKHKSWSMPAVGLKGNVGTDGSLLGAARKWGACCSSVVQLDYDEELEFLHGVYGSMVAEFEVQRTIKRAELTAFLYLPKMVIGPITVHVDKKGTIDVDVWIKISEELHLPRSKEILADVEPVKAHRTKKDKGNIFTI